MAMLRVTFQFSCGHYSQVNLPHISINKFVKLVAIGTPTVISFFPDEIIIKLEDVSFRIDRMQLLKGFDETV